MAANPAKLGVQFTLSDSAEALVRHLRGKLASPEDAEDIAQEACTRLLQADRKALDIRNPEAYLYRIAHNLLSHHYRAQARRPAPEDIDIEHLECGSDGVDEQCSEALRRELINRAIRELSPKCRRVLYMRWREGLRVAEIASHLELSQAMVKKYLTQSIGHCRTRLRRHIQEDH